MRNNNSTSFESHCSVISIRALRGQILSKTTLSNIYKCTFYFEHSFDRIGDDSGCGWRHSVVSDCFQSGANLRDTFYSVLELCTMGSTSHPCQHSCRVCTHSRNSLDSVFRISRVGSSSMGTLFRKYQSCSSLQYNATVYEHSRQLGFWRMRGSTGNFCRLCSWYSPSISYYAHISVTVDLMILRSRRM